MSFCWFLGRAVSAGCVLELDVVWYIAEMLEEG